MRVGDAQMQNPLTQVFACRQANCCRDGFALYIVLPLESRLGKYERKKYDFNSVAWPFDFRCVDCCRKSTYRQEDIVEVPVVGPGTAPHFEQGDLQGKGLWHVEISNGPYPDSEPQSIYTIAGDTLDWEHFIEQPEKIISKRWHRYDLLPSR